MRSPRPDPWFRSSERDLGMARHLLGAGFYEGVAFHSQQAAEKILKGLLISRHCLWRRTHSCAELLAALARLGDTLPECLLGAGSRARGSHSPDSDYDSVLVSDCFTDLEPAEQRVRPYRAWSATGSECDADIFCLAPTELIAMSDPLLWDAPEEGIPILDDGAWAAAVTEFHRLRAAGRLVAVEDGWLFAPPPSPAVGSRLTGAAPPLPPAGR
jgi:HEPN domain-containing protein